MIGLAVFFLMFFVTRLIRTRCGFWAALGFTVGWIVAYWLVVAAFAETGTVTATVIHKPAPKPKPDANGIIHY